MLTLVEIDDLVQRPVKMLLNNAHWSMPVTENPVLDSIEVWNLINLTDDAHPIHLHLVRFQILDSRAFMKQHSGFTVEVRICRREDICCPTAVLASHGTACQL
jgi:spore coat protein A